MSGTPSGYSALKQAIGKVVSWFQAGDELEGFTPSVPDAQTTTVDSVQGHGKRPPAIARCGGCESLIPQRTARTSLDCPDCHREYDERELGSLELVALMCPRCRVPMNHGIRHPMLFDTPEWATCPDCQYHWDLDHWFPAEDSWI